MAGKKETACGDYSRAMKTQEAHNRESTLTASNYAPEPFGDFDIADIINDTSEKFHFWPCQDFHSVDGIHKKHSLICYTSF